MVEFVLSIRRGVIRSKSCECCCDDDDQLLAVPVLVRVCSCMPCQAAWRLWLHPFCVWHENNTQWKEIDLYLAIIIIVVIIIVINNNSNNGRRERKWWTSSPSSPMFCLQVWEWIFFGLQYLRVIKSSSLFVSKSEQTCLCDIILYYFTSQGMQK